MSPQRELDRGLQKTELVAGIIAVALEAVGIDGAIVQQVLECVSELNFRAGAGLDGLNGFENLGCQHVAPDDGEVRRRVPDPALPVAGCRRRRSCPTRYAQWPVDLSCCGSPTGIPARSSRRSDLRWPTYRVR